MSEKTKRKISEIEKGGSMFINICRNIEEVAADVDLPGGVYLLSTPEGLSYIREMMLNIKDGKKAPVLPVILQANIDRCRKLARLFGVEFDPAMIKWPKEAIEDGYWVIPQFKDISAQEIADRCRKLFGGKFYTEYFDLDEAIEHDDRNASRDGTYVVVVRANVEADEVFKNLSADQIWQMGIKGITSSEGLMLELMYFLYFSLGQHLSPHITLCSGSRDTKGRVPQMYLATGGDVCVIGCDPGYSEDHQRVRQVVSSSLQ